MRKQIGVFAFLIWILLVSKFIRKVVDELFIKTEVKLQYSAPLEWKMKTAIKANT